jgi:hypothetical protein
MPKGPRKKVILSVVFGASAVFLLAFTAQFYLWQRHASETIERYRARLDALPGTPSAAAIQPPVLVEPKQAGDAWSFYEGILPAIRSGYATPWSQSPLRPEHDRLVAACAPVLEGLRQVFSRDTLTIPHSIDGITREDPSFRAKVGLDGAMFLLLRLARGCHLQHQDDQALEALILALGVSFVIREGPGAAKHPTLWSQAYEQDALVAWFEILGDGRLSTARLDWALQSLRRLLQGRSPVHERLGAQEILAYRDILEQEREGWSGYPYIDTRPSWRYAFSAHLARGSALPQIESAYKSLKGLESLAPKDWAPALDQILGRYRARDMERALDLVIQAYRQEPVRLRNWTIAIVATALAQYQSNNGRLPETLEELSPEILPTIPICPEGGEALQYKGGRIACAHTGREWKIGGNVK